MLVVVARGADRAAACGSVVVDRPSALETCAFECRHLDGVGAEVQCLVADAYGWVVGVGALAAVEGAFFCCAVGFFGVVAGALAVGACCEAGRFVEGAFVARRALGAAGLVDQNRRV